MTEINFKKKLWRINEPDAINAEIVTIDNDGATDKPETVEPSPAAPPQSEPIEKYIYNKAQIIDTAALPAIPAPTTPQSIQKKIPEPSAPILPNPIYEFSGLKFEQRPGRLTLVRI